jgi:hypothetical protein
MIGYATLGTNDIDTALAFYDALLATAGGYFRGPDGNKLCVFKMG